MDPELRFVSALLNGNQAEQNEFWLRHLPLSLFPIREQEVHWVYRFREKHSKFPSATAFEARFNETLSPVADPLSVVIEPLVAQHAFAQLKAITDDTGKMFDEKREPGEILAFFRESSAKLQSHSEDSFVDENMESTDLPFRRYLDQQKTRHIKGAFIDSPWGKMNKLLNFLRPGEQFVLAARPALGKTWMLLNWMNHLGSQGIPTLVISKEMPSHQISDRLTAIRFQLDWEKYRALGLDILDQVQWKIRIRKMAHMPYPIIVSGEETLEGTGLEQVYTKLQKLKPRAFAVDGAYLLRPKDLGKNANEVERFSSISRGLKRMAKVTSTVSFSVIQMNRSAETKAGVSKGGMTTLYGADAWGQDADTVCELGGERGQSERVVMVHKSRETNIGDFFINFKLSPFPNFSEKASLSASSALGSMPFKVL
jgi:replicative DNA helicase